VIAGLVVTMLVVGGPALSLPSIQNINCSQATGEPCPTPVIDALTQLQQQPLLFSSIDQRATQLLAPTGYVVKKYVRTLPDTLELTVAPLDIRFYLRYDEKMVAIAANGAQLLTNATPDDSKLHITIADQAIITNLKTSPVAPTWLVNSISPLEQFFLTTNLEPSAITLRSPFTLELLLQDKSNPILLNPQELSLNLARVSTILKDESIMQRASASATLDARFRLPVLRSVSF
jgi:hypothetical protein